MFEEKFERFDKQWSKFYDSGKLIHTAWTTWQGPRNDTTELCFDAGTLAMFKLLYDVVFSKVGYIGWRQSPETFIPDVTKEWSTKWDEFRNYCISEQAEKHQTDPLKLAFASGGSFVYLAT